MSTKIKNENPEQMLRRIQREDKALKGLKKLNPEMDKDLLMYLVSIAFEQHRDETLALLMKAQLSAEKLEKKGAEEYAYYEILEDETGRNLKGSIIEGMYNTMSHIRKIDVCEIRSSLLKSAKAVGGNLCISSGDENTFLYSLDVESETVVCKAKGKFNNDDPLVREITKAEYLEVIGGE